MEIWKEKHSIEVSNYGNVRKIVSKEPCNVYHDSFGYPSVTCKPEKGCRSVRIHRLVAELFIDNPECKKSVNHKDGNPKNNHVDNLEWCTQSHNIQHAYDTGLKKSVGRNHHWSKLKDHEILEINKLKFVYGLTHKLIASLYGISRQHVSDLTNRKRCWKREDIQLTL